MQAAVQDEAGPPNVIQLRTVPVPRLTPGHVIIALDYASVGSWDANLRSGEWGDLFADMVGAGMAAFSILVIERALGHEKN